MTYTSFLEIVSSVFFCVLFWNLMWCKFGIYNLDNTSSNKKFKKNCAFFTLLHSQKHNVIFSNNVLRETLPGSNWLGLGLIVSFFIAFRVFDILLKSNRSLEANPRWSKGRYIRGSLLPQHAPATRSRSKTPSSAPTICSEKLCCATKFLLPSFAPSYQTGLIWGSKLQGQICCTILFHEQAPSCVLKFALRERVSGASSLVCTEICFAGACFRSKLPRVYWLGYLPGSVFRERVSGASSFVCTGWSTYPEACFGSVFQEQAPSCVPNG